MSAFLCPNCPENRTTEKDEKNYKKLLEHGNILVSKAVNKVANLPTLFSPPPPQGGGALFVRQIFSAVF